MQKRRRGIAGLGAISIFLSIMMNLTACGFIQSEEGTVLPLADAFAAPRAAEPVRMKASAAINVPYLCQNPAFPTGCESVSAVMTLRFYGYDVTPAVFVDRYLATAERPLYDSARKCFTGADPNAFFLGDPRKGNGWGCFPAVIKDAVEAFSGGALRCTVLYGEPIYDLCARYIDRGVPVLLWATQDMQTPREGLRFAVDGTDSVYTWKGPMHCLVLTGYTENGYVFNDPLRGRQVVYDKKQTLDAYRAMGGRALAITWADAAETE